VSFIDLSITVQDANANPMQRWQEAVQNANEACIVLDLKAVVVAASPGCLGLLYLEPVGAVGRKLTDVLDLLDFNAVSGKLPEWEVDKIPPLLAISTAGLARGLLRVSDPESSFTTVDAIAVPLLDAAGVAGSLTFFAPVGRPPSR
jgi:hypothetical protein